LTIERLEDRSVPAFLAPVSLPDRGGAVQAADFNGDDVLDLVTVTPTAARVRLAGGDGTFQAPLVSPVTGSRRSLAVGDFNRDGDLDLVTMRYGTASRAGRLSFLEGNGDGTFQRQRRFALGSFESLPQRPVSLAAADLNDDDRLDLVVAADGRRFSNASSALFRANINVLLGRGDGTFRTGSTRPLLPAHLANTPLPLALGDFTDDGRLDVLAGTGDNFRSRFVTLIPSVLLLAGDGLGGLGPAIRVGLPGAPFTSLAVGDFSGDGQLDFATAIAADSTVQVMLGHGNGTFASVRTFATGNLPTGIVAADFSGDGRVDLATTGGRSGFARSDVSVLLGNGDGSFQPIRTFTAGPMLSDPLAADLDDDGFTDLVVRRGDTLRILLNDGNWRFA
jgi:hypothetical protein